MSYSYYLSRIEDAKKDLNWLEGRLELEGKICLEIGCGIGAKSWYFSQAGKYMVGVDISESVLGARQYINELPAPKNLDYSQADGENLPYISQSFDVVIMHDTMEHVLDPERVLSETMRVLRNNGQLSIIMPHYHGLSGNHLWNFFDGSLLRYLHLHLILPKWVLHKIVFSIGNKKGYSRERIQEEWQQYVTLNQLRPKRLIALLKEYNFEIERLDYRKGKMPFSWLWKFDFILEHFSWGLILVARKI